MTPPKLTFVDEARHWWRLWTIRLAALAGMAMAAVIQDPSLLTGLVVYAPGHWRPAVAAAVGILVFALPSAARLLKQRLPDAQ